MITLRPYQQDLLEKSQAALVQTGARVMTQLPTGGGKTEIAGALLKDFLVEGRKAVWLTHREELAEQSANRLKEHWLIPAMPVTEAWQRGKPAPYQPNGVAVLKSQTVGRRNNGRIKVWEDYGPEDLLVVDEVHHAPAPGWERAIEQWPGRVWGLTATPWRLSLREGFDHLFYTLVTGPQTSKMQTDGYLALSRVFAPTLDNRIRGGEVGQLGDFTEGGIERANDDGGDGGRFIMTTLAVKFWRNLAHGRQTVAYAVSKGHAANLVRTFTELGISAAAILSDTSSDDRTQVIKNFENRQITVLVNVAVATEGFDLPDASCVLITRPTKSLALYLQMIGRGLRPNKSDGNDCLVLDLAGNAEEHGLPEDHREWSLAARGNPAAGDPPVRYCHECNFMAHPAHHKCPECDADLGKPCPLCGKFRPWSRWAEESDCPHEHDTVCDYCHPDIHSAIGIGSFRRGESSLFYAQRAEENHVAGNLDEALADWFLAIHVGRADKNPGQMAAWHVYRANTHASMGNIDLAKADFATAESICEAGGLLTKLVLPIMHEERAKMYEDLGCHDKAELDRQKAKELNDIIEAGSSAE